ncbi:MAG TPA: NAD(P)-dependent alcohol dehydrogenase [Acidimicrobiales bacterium]|nr:NAD(P)-dependent alcohol dehydrogenase [Acidimicrobiales bacterium]
MRTVTAYATTGPKTPFQKTSIERRDVGPKDVLIKIGYAGICHSDLHTAWGEWGDTLFPLVPGHEIAGTVEQIGSKVTGYSVGDRVGVGCMVDSCRQCENCLAGLEQYCLNGFIATYNAIGKDGRATDGGYSTHIVVDEDFVLGIPEGITSDVAAPLMCAGITLYSPLCHWGAGPDRQIAIVGLGGLGHMGVKIAHAMGAEVTVLSHTPEKQSDAIALGADHFYPTSDTDTFDLLARRFDLIIDTVSAKVAIDSYLSLLRLDGSFVNVGAPPEPLTVHAFSLVDGRRSISGSLIGGVRETQEMLDFCAGHGIGADIEVIGGGEIDAAYQRMLQSNVHYRFVIDIASFDTDEAPRN